jgi:hypothetical protein
VSVSVVLLSVRFVSFVFTSFAVERSAAGPQPDTISNLKFEIEIKNNAIMRFNTAERFMKRKSRGHRET